MKHLLLIVLFLTACARDHAEVPEPQPNGSLYQLYLFAAEYCHPCKEELPELQKWYDSYEKKDRVITTVYLVAGNVPIKPATPESAEIFKKELGLSFKIMPDRHGKLQKKYYPTNAAIPSTVLLDGTGEVVHIFAPGKITGAELESWID